jgi:hypothetical protein
LFVRLFKMQAAHPSSSVVSGAEELSGLPPNGLELSCPAEAGNPPLLYGTPAGQASSTEGPARRVSFSELLGGWPIPKPIEGDHIADGSSRCRSVAA